MYVHPYPFAMYDGIELWLCPNTFHQANLLLKLYKQLNGPPDAETLRSFGFFPRGLVELYWQQVMEAQDEFESYEAWKAAQPVFDDGSTDYFDQVREL